MPILTRKQRAFLTGKHQERGESVHEPEGGPSTSSFSESVNAIDYGVHLLMGIKDKLSHSVIVTSLSGNSVLLVKTNEVYSLGFYNKELETETYSTLSEKDILLPFTKKIIKLQRNNTDPIMRVSIVTAEPPVSEEIAGKIISYKTLYELPGRVLSFGKHKKKTLTTLTNEIYYLNCL